LNHPEETRKERKERRFRKKALKGKGGIRKDFDVEDDKKYNYNVDDEEQNNIEDLLTNGFVNIKKVAEKLYPDHTPEGAQSQLNKKLRGDKSDSGSTYKLKNREVKRLKQIISTEF
jgi:type I restriction-modification system DNA methylase subunit